MIGNGLCSDRHACGRPKEEVYKWSATEDIGDFQRIDKNLLQVDPSYQRTDKLSHTRLTNICKSWNWIACGVLIVVRRMNGLLMVVDGMHRLEAAKKRTHITTLPCLVFDEASMSDEAKAFLEINLNRSGMPGLSKFKAMIAANDDAAVNVKQMIESSGYSHSTNHSQFSVKCVMLLVDAWREDKDVCAAIWSLMVDLHDGAAIIDFMFNGAFRLEQILRKKYGMTLLDPSNSATLKKAGISTIKAEIAKARAYYQSGGAYVFAQGYVNVLNHRRQEKNRIPAVA